MMSIGHVAAQTGVSTPTIRFYERIGLIDTPFRKNGQRRFQDDVLTRIRLIRMAQDAGFTLEETGVLLNGFSETTPASERWQELARRKIPEVEAMIDRLVLVRRVLDDSLACDCLKLDACAERGWKI